MGCYKVYYSINTPFGQGEGDMGHRDLKSMGGGGEGLKCNPKNKAYMSDAEGEAVKGRVTDAPASTSVEREASGKKGVRGG